MQELTSKYDILKVIGHGGYSVVLKARPKDDPSKVFALKQLDVAVRDMDSKEYRDFQEEVAILKRLHHPNIVKVYNEYILDGKPTLEMEYIDGETLESVLREEQCLSVEETIRVLEQMASALSYCHHYQLPVQELNLATDSALYRRNAIIHNDINPKNIVRTTNEDGSYHYVLIDFGLSFTDPIDVWHSKKEDGMAEYKSPEKWDMAEVDTPSDIYSFGIVVYELLTGSVPFPVADYKNEQQMHELEQKHKQAPVPDLCTQRKLALGIDAEDPCDVPDWLVYLVNKCLQKKPQDRFKTGRELRDFLDKCLLDGDAVDLPDMRQSGVIDIDPAGLSRQNAYIEVVPNIFTERQEFVLDKPFLSVGRWHDVPDSFLADIAIKTGDRFISKNHCQLVVREDETGNKVYGLQDTTPSKNGTYLREKYGGEKILPGDWVTLHNGDAFWIGNTKIVFHQ
ncbi:MAG: FHA domain-containing serine/threonine-protein kinase [Niabella sp.]